MKTCSVAGDGEKIKKYKIIIGDKKMWKKYFFGLSVIKIFQVIFDFQFISKYRVLKYFKSLVLIGLFLKITDQNMSNNLFIFLQIQEETVWGRFFLLLYFRFFLKKIFLFNKISLNRTDLRLIWKIKNLNLSKMEFLDETERLLSSLENSIYSLDKKRPRKNNKSCIRSVKLNVHTPLKKKKNLRVVPYSIF